MQGTSADRPEEHFRLRYRLDIDGLRAVAVLPVVLFHTGVGLFGGGYVGVDVFFVISGYLLTGVIAREIEGRTFSIIGFYERRCRRILPALFAMMLAVVVAGGLIFMPDELRDTGASLIGVSTFASNILFWQQIDYFNGAVELKPLLHTWSLAVEEQFYIVIPLLLIVLERVAPRRHRLPILTLTALSFVLSVVLMKAAPDANYYLLPSRAWELLVGAAIALGYVPGIRRRGLASLISALGLAAIIASAMLLTHDSPFPGYNALWPCIGAAAFIHANTGHPTPAGRLLGWKPFVAIGLISYSLYLVHWPMIVFTGYVLLRPPTAIETVVLFAAMIALAFLSWRFVERPFRNRHKVSQRAIFLFSGAGLLLFAGVGAALFLAKGLPQRFPGLKAAMVNNETGDTAGPKCFLKDGTTTWGGTDCFLTQAPGKPVVLLWGDSHANHYAQPIRDAQPPLQANILYFASAGCLPVLHNSGKPRPYCAGNNAEVLNIIKRFHVSTVVLSGYWQYVMDKTGMPVTDIEATVRQIRAMGLDVRIIGDNPDYNFANPQFLAYRLRQRAAPDAPFYLSPRNNGDINAQLRRIAGPGRFFDPMHMLCRADGCLTYEAGEILMTDNAHFSPYGAAKVLKEMRPLLER